MPGGSGGITPEPVVGPYEIVVAQGSNHGTLPIALTNDILLKWCHHWPSSARGVSMYGKRFVDPDARRTAGRGTGLGSGFPG